MGLTFVLKNADFSEKNLGQITLKDIGDVAQSTLDILESYGSKSFTNNQIVEIDNFLVGIKNLSFYNKITHMVIPILSPIDDVDKDLSTDFPFFNSNCAYDIITGTRIACNGFNGYVDNRGLTRTSKSVGYEPRLELTSNRTLDVEKLTIGCVSTQNLPHQCDYMYNVDSKNTDATTIQFGGTIEGKKLGDYSDINLPKIVTASITDTSIRGAVNGFSVTPVFYSKPIYNGNTRSTKELLVVDSDSSISLFFICEDYSMSLGEQQILQTLMKKLIDAIWD